MAALFADYNVSEAFAFAATIEVIHAGMLLATTAFYKWCEGVRSLDKYRIRSGHVPVLANVQSVRTARAAPHASYDSKHHCWPLGHDPVSDGVYLAGVALAGHGPNGFCTEPCRSRTAACGLHGDGGRVVLLGPPPPPPPPAVPIHPQAGSCNSHKVRSRPQHHQYRSTVSYAAEYANVADQILANALPTYSGPILFKLHPNVIFFWYAIINCVIVKFSAL